MQIKVDTDFVNSALFIFTRAKHTCGTYRPRAEDVERCICNDLADTYETSGGIAGLNCWDLISDHEILLYRGCAGVLISHQYMDILFQINLKLYFTNLTSLF